MVARATTAMCLVALASQPMWAVPGAQAPPSRKSASHAPSGYSRLVVAGRVDAVLG